MNNKSLLMLLFLLIGMGCSRKQQLIVDMQSVVVDEIEYFIWEKRDGYFYLRTENDLILNFWDTDDGLVFMPIETGKYSFMINEAVTYIKIPGNQSNWEKSDILSFGHYGGGLYRLKHEPPLVDENRPTR